VDRTHGLASSAVSDGFPNARRHALGKPRMGPVVVGSEPSPLTNESRKLAVRDPGAKNLSVMFLMSTRRSPSYMRKGLGMR